jgi:hypothetical protein
MKIRIDKHPPRREIKIFLRKNPLRKEERGFLPSVFPFGSRRIVFRSVDGKKHVIFSFKKSIHWGPDYYSVKIEESHAILKDFRDRLFELPYYESPWAGSAVFLSEANLEVKLIMYNLLTGLEEALVKGGRFGIYLLGLSEDYSRLLYSQEGEIFIMDIQSRKPFSLDARGHSRAFFGPAKSIILVKELDGQHHLTILDSNLNPILHENICPAKIFKGELNRRDERRWGSLISTKYLWDKIFYSKQDKRMLCNIRKHSRFSYIYHTRWIEININE